MILKNNNSNFFAHFKKIKKNFLNNNESEMKEIQWKKRNK